MQRLIMKAKTSGVTVVFSSEVVGIKRTESGYNVTVNNSGTSEILSAKIVINCAGLDSDTMAMKAGIDIKKCRYELRYCKGKYFRVNGRRSSYINRLVYPVPKPKAGGLGIHATPDLSGGLRLGPDHEYLENRAKDYSVSTSKRPDFYVSASKFMPFIEESDISADTSGIRPQLKDYGSDFRDFIIKDETDNGLPGLINLIGIESPGLTASLAIGEYVLKICRDLGRAG